MSDLGNLVKHSSHYFGGQVLLLFASFISFPLYTRLLSVSEYGLLTLVTTSILITTSFSKLGLQNSIIRFYPDFQSKVKGGSASIFYSTYVLSIFFCGTFFSIVFLLTVKLLSENLIGASEAGIFSLASILILIYCGLQTYAQFFRAEQRPIKNVIINLLMRYGNIGFGLLFYLYIEQNLFGFFLGVILWEGALFILTSFNIFRSRKISFGLFSLPLFKDALRYGFPLLGIELSYLVLQFGDQYIIRSYLGPIALGIYSAGYSIACMAGELLIFPVRNALMPIYMDIYSRKGFEETKLFLSITFKYFLLVAVPIIFGVIALAPELTRVLASEKYAQSCEVIPFVLVGVVIYGSSHFFDAWLLLKKKTNKLVFILGAACFLNIVLNIILIPQFNIKGAAISTLVAFSLYTVLIVLFSYKKLMFHVDIFLFLRNIMFAYIMYVVITKISLENVFASLGLKIVIGIILYIALIMIFERDLRYEIVRNINSYIKNLKGR